MLKVTTCLKLALDVTTAQGDNMNDGRELSLLDDVDECLVGGDRGRTGGETEDEWLVCGGCKVVYAVEDVRERCRSKGEADRFEM